jgi:hypothetical protein
MFEFTYTSFIPGPAVVCDSTHLGQIVYGTYISAF